MIKYNICFMKQGSNILLLNREYSSWMGCWNGIGGKLESGESPRRSMIRELEEETGVGGGYKLVYGGIVSWTVDGMETGGMYLYLAELPEDIPFSTPVKTREGILDWKAVDWILHPDNLGIATNIKVFLPYLLSGEGCYHYHCVYIGNNLADIALERIDRIVMEDAAAAEAYIRDRHAEPV